MNKLILLSLLILAGCGDSTVVVPTEPVPADGNTTATSNANNADNNATVDTDPPEGEQPMPDLPAPPDPQIPEPEPTPEPTEPVVQPSYTVQMAVDQQCSTGKVNGLSRQLIDQMNCMIPGVMKSFGGSDSFTYGTSVFPFQQGPATDALIKVVSGSGKMTINSALRTLPQQYLLYQWYVRSKCNANLAAAPGKSNHNGGTAVDINSSSTWRTKMRNNAYIDNVSGEPWHFNYSGSGARDVRNLSVLAFQQLWNRNYPNDKIDEDGLYGPQTEGALKRAPAEGFAIGPMCMATMSLVGYPLDVPVEALAEEGVDGDMVMRVLAPAGIEVVEYRLDGEVVGSANRGDDPFFQVSLNLPQTADLEIVAYDHEGRARGQSVALIRAGWVARPTGHNHYAVVPRGAAYFDPTRVPFGAHVVPGWQELLITGENLVEFDDHLLR